MMTILTTIKMVDGQKEYQNPNSAQATAQAVTGNCNDKMFIVDNFQLVIRPLVTDLHNICTSQVQTYAD